MKVLINRKPVDGPWGGGNLFVKAFSEKLPLCGHDVVYEFSDDIDIIFVQDPRYSDLGISINEIVAYKQHRPHVRIIHRVNECDARKGTADMDNLLRATSQYTDHTIFVSEWIRQYHMDRDWGCKNTSVVYNGVNRDHFSPPPPGGKMNNGKINIVTHHWSSNRMKGFDIYEAIDDFVGKYSEKFTFTYIGRELGTFKHTRIIPPKFGKDLGDELAHYNVYVSGTKFDPGPNHILESLACQIPTYVYNLGGGAVEFAGESHIFKSIEEILEILDSNDFIINKFLPYDWGKCIEQYVKYFK